MAESSKDFSETKINTDELMAEFDKESNTRRFTGVMNIIVKSLMVFFAVYAIITSVFEGFLTDLNIGFIKVLLGDKQKIWVFLGFILVITYLIFPAYKKQVKKENFIPFYDYILAAASIASCGYMVIEYEAIVFRSIDNNTLDIIFGIMLLVVLVEACRRVVGIPILCVVGVVVLVVLFVLGEDPLLMLNSMVFTENGISGTPLSICTQYLGLFIIFGSFLEKTGIGAFFVDLANSVAGWAAGGPAKVAVISSALEGMYSGSSVANTVGSGSVTIPTMKRIGYKPEFAAAVEAAASTGGQIMPPIMGAAAFLMAESTDIPYIVIAIAAILPALLYFTGIFVMIHFEAKKMGMKGLSKEDIPHFGKLFLKKGYLLLPIVILVALMGNGKSPALSVAIAILSIIIVSSFSKDTRLNPSKACDALVGGTRGTIAVAIACAVSGNMIALISQNGLASEMTRLITAVSGHSLFLSLVLIMVICILLGMGIPTTANYLIVSGLTVPMILTVAEEAGLIIPKLAAHMFVFYFGIVADITPPVALAAYAGSAIAKSDPLKTGITATRLAVTAFIVPYIFIFQPDMLIPEVLFSGENYETLNITVGAILSLVKIVCTSIVGIIGVSAAMEGYAVKKCDWWERIIFLVGGLCLIVPETITDIIGIVLVGGMFVYQIIGKKFTKE